MDSFAKHQEQSSPRARNGKPETFNLKQQSPPFSVELHLAGGCGNLCSMSTLTDIDPKELRPLLHAEIDRLKDEDLAAAHRALLEIEMQRLLGEMDDATDRAWESGQITEEKIEEAILEHRRKNPYP